MITIEQLSGKDVERTALYQTLSKLLDTQAMETVFSYFEENHILSMTDGYPITRSQIHDALESFFHYGASTIMTEYDKTFYQLVSDTESTA